MSRHVFRRIVAALARAMFHGLALYGAAVSGVPLRASRLRARPAPAPPMLPGPPAGHPERAAAHIAPTAAERRLWTQLTGHVPD